MNIDNITGGVSPLKARQATRGGKYAGAATATSGRRGGFAKSAGARGAGGRNVGGYNVQTRFTPSGAWRPPGSGGTTIIPSTPPVVGGKNTTKKTKTEGTEGYWTYKDLTTEHEYDNLESYKKVWDKNDKDLQSKYTDDEDMEAEGAKSAYDKFVDAAEAWWKTDAGKKEREKRSKGKYTTTKRVKDKWIPGTSATTTTTTS